MSTRSNVDRFTVHSITLLRAPVNVIIVKRHAKVTY